MAGIAFTVLFTELYSALDRGGAGAGGQLRSLLCDFSVAFDCAGKRFHGSSGFSDVGCLFFSALRQVGVGDGCGDTGDITWLAVKLCLVRWKTCQPPYQGPTWFYLCSRSGFADTARGRQ